MVSEVRFGIAGWQYPDWEGIVYPAKKPRGFEPLELIASMVDAVEINSSFYSPLSPNSGRKWMRILAPFKEFRFSAKLWQRFTHEKGVWTVAEVLSFRRGLDPLLDAGLLGALLCQFPWSFRNTEDNLLRLKKIGDDFRGFPLVVELRHGSWQDDLFFAWLKKTKIGFANIDQPLFHDSMPPTEIATSKIGYIRLHGRNYKTWFKKEAETRERYDYLYPKEELEEWLPRIRKVAGLCQQMFVIANNHFQGKELANALMFKFMCTRKKQRAPQSLIRRYPELKEFCSALEPQRELFQQKMTR